MKKKHKNKVEPGKGITNPKLAKKLNRILIEKNLSKEKFAEKLGEPLPYILEIMKGRRSIQLHTLIKICKVLNTPILDFADCIKEESQ